MTNSRTFILFRCFLITLLLGCNLVAHAQNSNTENTQAQNSTVDISSLAYIEDPQLTLSKDAALTQLMSEQAIQLENAIFNVGSHDSHFWLLLSINNNTEQTSLQKLVARVPYRLGLQAFLVNTNQNNRFELILNEDQTTPFSARKSNFRLLNTELIEILPNETTNILISYETRGSTFLPFSLESPLSFAEIVNADNVLSAWFYAVGLSLGLLFLLLTLIMKSPIGSYYATLFLLGLLLIATIDGFSFKFIWPDSPRWNQSAALYILLFINAAGFYISSKVSNLGVNQILFKKISLALAFINLLLIAFVVKGDFSVISAIANVFLFLMLLFNVIAMSSWISSKRNKFTTLTMVIITFFVGVLAVLFFFSQNLPDAFISYANYTTYLLIGIAVMTIISAQMLGLRKDHEIALEKQLEAIKREAEMNKSLFEAEKNYSRVREVARQRQQQLATASHDIRQPLISLRSTMDSISHKQSPEIKQQLHDAFDYMEQLCNSYLQESRPEEVNALEETGEAKTAGSDYQISHSLNVAGEESADENTTIISSEIEPYPVSLILSTIKQMFETEALAKGLEFRMVNSSFITQLPPLVLMRIVSNFTSNAIKNTNKGKVLIGCRRLNNGIRIEVHDTGNGIKNEAIDKLQQLYQKGESSDGEGLGLAITRELAEQHNLKISIHSIENKGSCFALEI
ncbi:ATP-binding protein [uncultured Cocleimonas sp.]|uniref:ATP-binding protein n=1 Tax=uncultured Cocleimonas sp. TaxID=1051587 RepID=UPI002604F45E|nr:ATP-binding protein [uncultured Cocleimonas sp.]